MTQDGLEEKIDRLTTMMSKLTSKYNGLINSSHLIYSKVKEENRREMSMTDVIMIREIIKIGIDQTMEIEEFHLVVEYSVDKIIEID